jgi:hypothetical protein
MIFVLRLTTWIVFVAIAVMTLGPVSLRPHTLFPPDFDRFAAYAVLGVLFALSYPRRPPWLMGAFLVAAAGAFEIGQLFVPHRDAHVNDFLFKAAGALIGLIVGRFAQPFVAARNGGSAKADENLSVHSCNTRR